MRVTIPKISQPRSVPRDYITQGDVENAVVGWCRQAQRDGHTISLRALLARFPTDGVYHPLAAWFFGSVMPRMLAVPTTGVQLHKAIVYASAERFGSLVTDGVLDYLYGVGCKKQHMNRSTYWTGRHAGKAIVEALALEDELLLMLNLHHRTKEPLLEFVATPF